MRGNRIIPTIGNLGMHKLYIWPVLRANINPFLIVVTACARLLPS